MAARRGNQGRQELLAAALAVGKTLKAAAKAAGVSERTARTWFAEPGFKVKVAELRGRMVSAALGVMVDGLTAAAKTLRRSLSAKNEAVRVTAAKALVELALKMRDATDLQALVMGLHEDMDRQASVIGLHQELDGPGGRRNGNGFGDDPAGPENIGHAQGAMP